MKVPCYLNPTALELRAPSRSRVCSRSSSDAGARRPRGSRHGWPAGRSTTGAPGASSRVFRRVHRRVGVAPGGAPSAGLGSRRHTQWDMLALNRLRVADNAARRARGVPRSHPNVRDGERWRRSTSGQKRGRAHAAGSSPSLHDHTERCYGPFDYARIPMVVAFRDWADPTERRRRRVPDADRQPSGSLRPALAGLGRGDVVQGRVPPIPREPARLAPRLPLYRIRRCSCARSAPGGVIGRTAEESESVKESCEQTRWPASIVVAVADVCLETDCFAAAVPGDVSRGSVGRVCGVPGPADGPLRGAFPWGARPRRVRGSRGVLARFRGAGRPLRAGRVMWSVPLTANRRQNRRREEGVTAIGPSRYGRKPVNDHDGLLWHGVLTGGERRTDGATQANTLRDKGQTRRAAPHDGQ